MIITRDSRSRSKSVKSTGSKKNIAIVKPKITKKQSTNKNKARDTKIRKRSQSAAQNRENKKPQTAIETLQTKIKAKDMHIMDLMKELGQLREMVVQQEQTIVAQKKIIKRQKAQIDEMI